MSFMPMSPELQSKFAARRAKNNAGKGAAVSTVVALMPYGYWSERDTAEFFTSE